MSSFLDKKDLNFDHATHIVAILYCHYTFLILKISEDKATPSFACHYKKTTCKTALKNIFFDVFKADFDSVKK